MQLKSPVIYVYTDTRWQNVNLVPAIVLGKIDQLIILTARRGGEFRSLDEANAERTHHGFISAYEAELARRGVNAVVPATGIEGPLVDMQTWRTAVSEELRKAPPDATLVLNYLSGPTDVKLAAWLAFDDVKQLRPDLKMLRVLYDAPSQLEWHDGDRQWIESAQHLVSLDGWLRVHGLAEPTHNRSERKEREARARASADLTRQFANLVFRFSGMPSGWWTQISAQIEKGHTSDLIRIAEIDPVLKRASAKPRAEAFKHLHELLEHVACRFAISGPISLNALKGSHDFIQYLTAGWFEEFVFLELADRVARIRSAGEQPEVALGLHPYPVDWTENGEVQGQSPACDIDVALLASNQLHAIECKAIKRKINSASRQKFLDRARVVKETVVGPGGMVLLASTATAEDVAMTRTWAKLGQVEFAAGWDEVSAKLDDLVRRCH